MATIVLTAAGSFLGPAGAAVGGLIGGLIDTFFLYPALTPHNTVDAPKLGELEVQTGNEGGPIHKVYGPENRVSGTIIWLSDLIEESKESGGKGTGIGGGSSVVKTNEYFVHVAIGLCEGVVGTVQKIWADGKLIYDNIGNLLVVGPSVLLSSEVVQVVEQNLFTGPTVVGEAQEVVSTPAGPNLTAFKVNQVVEIAGFDSPTNNGIFTVLEVSGSGGSETRMRVNNQASVDEAIGESVTLTQVKAPFKSRDFQSIVVQPGSDTQPVSSLIESFEGAGNVPRFTGICYAVLEKFALANYGNRMPIFSFLVDADPAAAAGSVSTQQSSGFIDRFNSALNLNKWNKSPTFNAFLQQEATGSSFELRWPHTASGGLFLPDNSLIAKDAAPTTGSVTFQFVLGFGPVFPTGGLFSFFFGSQQSSGVVQYSGAPDRYRIDFFSNGATGNVIINRLVGGSAIVVGSVPPNSWDFGVFGSRYVIRVAVSGLGTGTVTIVVDELTDPIANETATAVDATPLSPIGSRWGFSIRGAEPTLATGDYELDNASRVNFDGSLGSAGTVGPPADIADVVSEIIERTFLTAAEIDVAAIVAHAVVKGYAIAGPKSVIGQLEPLLLAHDIAVRETDGKLVFFPREGSPVVAIAPGDLAARSSTDAEPAPIVTVSDLFGGDLPSEINVRYQDPSNDYQQASQRERRIVPAAFNATNINLPLVLDADKAREIAMRKLWEPWTQRQTVRFTLPPEYFYLAENDIVTVIAEGNAYAVRLTRIDRGANFMINAEGIAEDVSVYTQSSVAENKIGQNLLEVAANAVLAFVDLAPLREEDVNAVKFYIAAAAGSASASWLGATLFESVDNSTFTGVLDIPSETTMGRVTTPVLGDVTSDPHTWDRANTIRVSLFHGALSSVTEQEVLNGANIVMLGGEVFAFQTATLVTTGVYDLSKLIRGLRGTEGEVGNHVANEQFVVLSFTEGLRVRELAATALEAVRFYKGVPANVEVDAINSIQHAIVGGTIRPFAPANLAGTRDNVTDDVTFTWQRRTRSPFVILNAAEPPNANVTEEYRIRILSGPGGTLVSEFTVTDVQTFTYTAAQQTTDGFTPGDPITAEIGQFNVTFGLTGRVREETIA